MRITDLLSQIQRPLLADGAFGTYFRGRTQSDRPCELANVEQPELVRNIHHSYLTAGAQVLYSNTFAANFRLTPDLQRLQAVITAGLNLARQAAGDKAAVLADIGPINFRGANMEEDPAEAYLRLTRLFCDAGAQDFVFETMPGFTELLPSLRYIREQQPNAFVLLTFAVSQDGYSQKGLYYKELLDDAYNSGVVNAAGLNCVCGPGHMVRLLADYDTQGKLLAALPNAGYPTQVNNRLVYEDNEDYYAARLAELAQMGCFLVGGCCGSTPAHIAKAASLLPGVVQSNSAGERLLTPVQHSAPGAPRSMYNAGLDTHIVPDARTGFAHKLKQRQRAVVVELNPPVSSDVEQFLSAARAAAEAGADIISVTDSPLARVRADSLMLAAKLQRELGLEALPHLSCRDRNRLGLKAALLGAAIEGIRYVLAVRGDAAEDAVFSLNSRELISFINSLNRELLVGEGIMCGGALNVNAVNFSAELKRAQAKQQAGCSFFLTQPVLDERGMEHAALAAQTLAVPVLAGILPVAGYKNALFLQQEVGGINIPDSLINSLKGADAAEARAVILEHCRNIMRGLKTCCGGFYLSTPLNRIDIVCELAAEAQDAPARAANGGALNPRGLNNG